MADTLRFAGVPGQRQGPYNLRYTWSVERGLGLWHSIDLVRPDTQALADHMAIVSVVETEDELYHHFLTIDGKTGMPMSTRQQLHVLAAWGSSLLERDDVPAELLAALNNFVNDVLED